MHGLISLGSLYPQTLDRIVMGLIIILKNCISCRSNCRRVVAIRIEWKNTWNIIFFYLLCIVWVSYPRLSPIYSL